MFTFCLDKARLARHFEKDPVLFAYHTGDLDDFYFPFCQYAAIYGPTASVEDVALIFSAGGISAVQMFGLTEHYPDFLRELLDVLPATFYGHFFEAYRPVLEERCRIQHIGHNHKMWLKQFQPADRSRRPEGVTIRRMLEEDNALLVAFYREAYPDGYFIPKMRETGKYFGLFEQERLASVAGVHVYAPEYKIGVLGSIATLPESRGKGYAQMATSHLVEELLTEGLRISLNVKGDNVPAITVYEKLGFVKTHEYEEAYLEMR